MHSRSMVQGAPHSAKGAVETDGDLEAFLRRVTGIHTGPMIVAVVGNGPLHEYDRVAIDNANAVIRFNDMNYLRNGEKTTLRVVRKPSAVPPKVRVDVPIWYIAPTKSMVPSGAPVFTPVYERQYGGDNDLPSDARIFSGCGCGDSCLQRGTFAGPSTGAVALSQLQQLDAIGAVNIYGMNWAGRSDIHIDFRNSSLVPSCCIKCTVHPTYGNYYGTGLTAAAVSTIILGGGYVGGVLISAWIGRRLTRRRKPAEHARPLIALPPGGEA